LERAATAVQGDQYSARTIDGIDAGVHGRVRVLIHGEETSGGMAE
jgi:hypothetical protein